MHKIHVKKDPSKLYSQVRSRREIATVCVTHDKVLMLLKKETDWSADRLSCKNLFQPLVLHLFQFFTLKELARIYKIK